MTPRRVAYLVEIALAVFVAGLGTTAMVSAFLYGRAHENYDVTYASLKGALMLISAAGFALAAWYLRGSSRAAWTKHWVSLLVAFAAFAAQLWGLRIERGPTPLTGVSLPRSS